MECRSASLLAPQPLFALFGSAVSGGALKRYPFPPSPSWKILQDAAISEVLRPAFGFTGPPSVPPYGVRSEVNAVCHRRPPRIMAIDPLVVVSPSFIC